MMSFSLTRRVLARASRFLVLAFRPDSRRGLAPSVVTGWVCWVGLVLATPGHAQSASGLPDLKFVAIKSTGGDHYSFEPFASLGSIADGAKPLSRESAHWAMAQPRAIGSDGDQWFAILRSGPSTCYARYASYEALRAQRSSAQRCVDSVADGYRGLAYDGKLFYTVFWDGGRHWWQSYRTWDDVVERRAFHKQNDRRNQDVYRSIGYDPTQQSYYAVHQSGRTLLLDRYASFSDMVSVRPGIDRRSVVTDDRYAAVMLGPINPTLEVFLVAGQSNAVGWDADGAWLSPDPADGHIPFFYRIGNGATNAALPGPTTSTSATSAITLGPQVAAFRDASGAFTNFGIEMGAGRTLFAAGRRNFSIVKVAFGSTTLARDWNPQNPEGLLPMLQDNLSLATQQWSQAGWRVRLAGVFWMQGETDARDSAQAAAYRDNLRGFLRVLRAWSGNPRLPVVLGKIGGGRPYSDVVRSAQEEVRADDTCTAIVSADDLPLQPGDAAHFSAPGVYALGQRMGEAQRTLSGC